MDAVLVGKERRFNRRFEQLCSHHLVEPVACSPAAGWEKGQVESQVKLSRQRFFTPRLRVADYDELNAILRERARAHAAEARHLELREQTILEVFEEERPALIPSQVPSQGFQEVTAAVSKTCLVSFDRNRYSVQATAVGRPVQIRAQARRIVILQDGKVVGEHARIFGRDRTVYDPWHYVPVLARKPGALRNGAPFKALALPPALTRLRSQLAGAGDGDRQMVTLLVAAQDHGLDALEAACKEALAARLGSADAVLNILSRQSAETGPAALVPPDRLRLREDPTADCARDDQLIREARREAP